MVARGNGTCANDARDGASGQVLEFHSPRRMAGALRGSLIRATDAQSKSQNIRDARRGQRRPYNALVRLYDEVIAHDHTGHATNELRGAVRRLLEWMDEREAHYWPDRWKPAA